VKAQIIFGKVEFMNYISIDGNSKTPKYQQIVNGILSAIEDEKILLGDQLPSIQHLCNMLSLSRDTVFNAYKTLKAQGIVASTFGKGHYVASTNILQKQKILLILADLSAMQEHIFQAFIDNLGKTASLEILVHHYNPQLFASMIEENSKEFTAYVLTPFDHPKVKAAIQKLPRKKVYILDRGKSSFGKIYPAVYQDFHKDIQRGLKAAMPGIKKYRKIILVFAHLVGEPKSYFPISLRDGLINFCEKKGFQYEVISTLDGREVKEGELYIPIKDNDLVYIIKEARKQNLIIGKQLGIISYNDIPLKEVIGDNGISVISTNFKQMGAEMAKMVMEKKKDRITIPGKLIDRGSA